MWILARACCAKWTYRLVEAKVGGYVLVHAGYAIQVVEEKDALETLSLWNDILAAGQ